MMLVRMMKSKSTIPRPIQISNIKDNTVTPGVGHSTSTLQASSVNVTRNMDDSYLNVVE